MKDGSGKTLKTAAEVVTAIKEKVEGLTKNWSTKIDILKSQYELWVEQFGDTATNAEILKKKTESLTEQIAVQEKSIAAMLTAYEKIRKQYGANSTEALEYQSAILKEKSALAELNKELKETNEELSHGASLDSFMQSIDAQYELWYKVAGKTADLVDVYATKADSIEAKIGYQKSIVEDSVKAYNEAVNKYGAGSAEVMDAQMGVYKAVGDLQDLNDELEKINKGKAELNAGAGVSQIDFSESALAKTNAATINAMNNNPELDVEMTAEMVTPDGVALATWLLKPLIDVARANGTPIVNPL